MIHEHNYKRTANKHAKELRAKGLEVTVAKKGKRYCVYSYRK